MNKEIDDEGDGEEEGRGRVVRFPASSITYRVDPTRRSTQPARRHRVDGV